MTPVTVYVPRDASARSVGADEVADVLARLAGERGIELTIVRNGSRGMLWLEPLVEVDTPAGRIAYGPVSPGDVGGLVEAGLAGGAPHPLRLGPTEEIPWLARQHPADLRPRRRHRPARRPTTTRRTAASPGSGGRSRWSPGRSSRPSPTRGFAGGAVPASPPASSGDRRRGADART